MRTFVRGRAALIDITQDERGVFFIFSIFSRGSSRRVRRGTVDRIDAGGSHRAPSRRV